MRPWLFILLLLVPAPARAATDCAAAYDDAVHPYWLIVDDILTYHVMFDNYDRLCSRYYPGVVSSLEPQSDLLRAQVRRDAAETKPVMGMIIDQALPVAVPSACRDDKATRARLKTGIFSAMAGREKLIARRLKDDSTDLPDPQTDLSICTRLPGLAPLIVKTLGPDLAHPLREMSVLNSHWVTGDEKNRAPYITNYRDAQAVWERNHQ